MARYNIQILPSVIKKDFKKVPTKDVEAVMGRIQALGDNPRPTWSKKLSGREEYRARYGTYRILYVIEDKISVVQVTKVGRRSSVYK